MPKSLKSDPIPLNRAEKVAKALLRKIRPQVKKAMVVGSIHRRHAQVYDIDILFVPKGSVSKLLRIKQFRGIPVNMFPTNIESWGASTLHWRTGKSIIQLKRYASKKGYTLNRYGLYDKKTGKKVAGKTEEGIFNALGLRYIGKKWRGSGTMKLIPE